MKPLLLAPLLLLVPADTTLRLAPAKDLVLEKHFRAHTRLEGGDLVVVMDGQEVPPEFLPELEVTIEHTTELRFRDRYVSSKDGRVLELVRSFLDLEDSHDSSQVMSGEGMDSESEASTTGESSLEGEHVRFRWDADEQEYGVEFERGQDGVDTTPLDGLVADADLSAFLPAGPVAPGDTWTVPAAAFEGLFSPGGDLAFDYSGDEAEDLNAGLEEVRFEGELELTLRGENTRDGATLATIAVAGEVTVVMVTATDLDHIPVVDGLATQTTTQVCTLEGELVWDVGAGHLASIELQAQIEAMLHIEKDADSPGPTFESTVSLFGEATFSAGFEAAD